MAGWQDMASHSIAFYIFLHFLLGWHGWPRWAGLGVFGMQTDHGTSHWDYYDYALGQDMYVGDDWDRDRMDKVCIIERR
jgi:hypothetical protein